jgi:hypothetical protein
LQTYKGHINIRIPIDSAFQLVATAPSSRSITLGSFTGAGLKFNGDGRQVTGSVGGGGASLTVNYYQGAINFFRR